MQKDPAYKDEVRKDPQDFKKFKNIKGQEYGDKTKEYGKKESLEDSIIEGWADNITEQKPYVSMYKGDDNKMVYDVLDKEGESAFKSDDYKVATDYLKKNFNQLSGQQPTMDDVNENPETDYEGSFDYELYGDDGETAYGKIHYKAVNGKVDPKSLQGEYEYEGNARVDDELATQMIQPGGDEHDEALKAAQDDYNYESQRVKSAKQPVENVSIDDEYRFRDWLKKTHNKEVHELKPQEYAIISKQYRDEKDKKESNYPDEETATEGNEFAQAVNKAKAAGMKPGDKFTVGDKEYTLKDAIEQAGLQLETFFGEDEVEADTQQPAELDHIKKLAGI